jgi:anti-sigma B factor antagonist
MNPSPRRRSDPPPQSAGPRPFSCRRFSAGSAVRVAVRGELDILTVPRLDRALRRAQSHADSIILDLRELDFVDSSGAHLLVASDRRIREAGGRLVVVRGPDEVDWFFRLVGLDRALDVVDLPAPGAAPAAGLTAGRQVLPDPAAPSEGRTPPGA